MAYDNLLTGDKGAVRTITINRPDKLNALNRATLLEIQQAIIEAHGDDQVRVIVLTGAGDKAFVAGADIGEIRQQSPTEARAFSAMGQNLMVTAERAAELGLVNRVVEQAELETAVGELTEGLASQAPEAVRGILQAVQQGAETSLEAGLALETARFALCCATEDMKEGTSAFLEKRAPRFTGR